eukprot:c8635_g1_i1.p1 GENE.c8635_g1_i1~~c8635_g1_i1.p1  ORF type:complete len:460 (+),score=86.16 c8635_g1_i1:105-1382(+)
MGIRKKEAKTTKDQMVRRRSGICEEIGLDTDELDQMKAALKLQTALHLDHVFLTLCGTPINALGSPVHSHASITHLDSAVFLNLIALLLLQHYNVYDMNLHRINWDGFVICVVILTQRVWLPPLLLMLIYSKKTSVVSKTLMAKVAAVCVCLIVTLGCVNRLHSRNPLANMLLLPLCVFWLFIFLPRCQVEAGSSRWVWSELRDVVWFAFESAYFASVVPLLMIEDIHLVFDIQPCRVVVVVAILSSFTLRLQHTLSAYRFPFMLHTVRIRALRRKSQTHNTAPLSSTPNHTKLNHISTSVDPSQSLTPSSAGPLIPPPPQPPPPPPQTQPQPNQPNSVVSSSPSHTLKLLVEDRVTRMTDLFLLLFSDPSRTQSAILALCGVWGTFLFVLTACSSSWQTYFLLLMTNYLISLVCVRERRLHRPI